ncbi:Flagellar basal-body rod protein FlgB [Syntrophomonas zehnderi OL-4]|uniref:Flagellar basal body rod protein FlgB n=1 Tax=Syntrophomonas zehnderi OL-4 TaxID=690567 RepID=A0A0E4GDV8_9FIRM|nr:flagellar basal body rod protein FlgB [Syntrophomonas zehnderi]CFX64496.1 Flagellar basal-body rod protein FlgB [Syntrophomonas zehnderi OL-4]
MGSDEMLNSILNNRTQLILNKSMDAASLRNEVIAHNIANVNTPKFKRSEVLFEDKMKKILSGNINQDKLSCTNPRHMQINQTGLNLKEYQPDIKKLNDLSYRNDENNVDIDVENANLTKNKIYYDSVSQSMSNEIKLLRMAIVGRG